ncbi:MAG TPA: hypothetical protein VFO31_04385 [Vicinamibacterales bacterium]|nr:hypothetical protein [Vicinamibacterales bacterium]
MSIGAKAVALDWDDPSAPPVSDYWALLAAHPAKIVAKRYDSQTQINADSEKSPNTHVTFDATQRAAKVQFVNDALGDASLPNQVRPRLPRAYTTGTLFFCWDAKWHPHYGDAGYRAGLDNHKCFQLANHTVSGDQRRIEPRMRYGQASSPDIAKVDTRLYPGDAMTGQLAAFTVKPATWTRRWSFVEFQSATAVLYSEWIADETRTPVRLFARRPCTLINGGGLAQFWVEFNSSQTRPSTAGPLIAWVRDFATLAGLSESAAVSLVAQGAKVP